MINSQANYSADAFERGFVSHTNNYLSTYIYMFNHMIPRRYKTVRHLQKYFVTRKDPHNYKVIYATLSVYKNI